MCLGFFSISKAAAVLQNLCCFLSPCDLCVKEDVKPSRVGHLWQNVTRTAITFSLKSKIWHIEAETSAWVEIIKIQNWQNRFVSRGCLSRNSWPHQRDLGLSKTTASSVQFIWHTDCKCDTSGLRKWCWYCWRTNLKQSTNNILLGLKHVI